MKKKEEIGKIILCFGHATTVYFRFDEIKKIFHTYYIVERCLCHFDTIYEVLFSHKNRETMNYITMCVVCICSSAKYTLNTMLSCGGGGG